MIQNEENIKSYEPVIDEYKENHFHFPISPSSIPFLFSLLIQVYSNYFLHEMLVASTHHAI